MASRIGRRVQWRDVVSGRRLTRTLATEAGAIRFAQDRETEASQVKDGVLSPAQIQVREVSRRPIEELVAEFRAELVTKGDTAAYVAERLRILGVVLEAARVRTVADLIACGRGVAAYLRERRSQGCSRRTCNGDLSAVRAFAAWCVRHEFLERDPTSAIAGLDSRPEKKSRPLTVLELERLRAVVPADRAAFYQFRCRTGLRARECSRLLWSDVCERDGDVVLRVRADVSLKDGEATWQPIASDLEEVRAMRWRDPGARIFRTLPAWATFARDLERAGIEQVTPEGLMAGKSLRNTFDSHLKRAGVDWVTVLLLMRHAPPAGLALTAGRYADPEAMLQEKRAALETMVKWYAGEVRRLSLTG